MTESLETKPEEAETKLSLDATVSRGRDAVSLHPVARLPEEWRESLEKAGERFPSEHFAQEATAELWINDLAKPYPKVGSGYAPAAGALVVEKLFRGREPTPFATYVMERVPVDGGAGWSYLALRPDGTVEDGGTHLCARCHGEAPDGRGVFGRAP